MSIKFCWIVFLDFSSLQILNSSLQNPVLILQTLMQAVHVNAYDLDEQEEKRKEKKKKIKQTQIELK